MTSGNAACRLGSMNGPEKQNLHTSVFYIPRKDEMSFEEKLIENHINKEKDELKIKS